MTDHQLLTYAKLTGRYLTDEQWLELIKVVHDDGPYSIRFPAEPGDACIVTDERLDVTTTISADGRVV